MGFFNREPMQARMPRRYDVIVLGLGAMGSSAAHHLAQRGYDILGIDRHHPPHPYGSSHGRTRVIRKAYFEDPGYVPWVERAYTLWGDLESASGRRILHETGGLHLGTPEGTQVPGARRALDEHGLAYEDLTSDEVRDRFPAFAPTDEHEAVLEPEAGFVQVHAAIEAQLDLAREHGAELLFGTQAWGWAEHPTHVRVSTHEGEAFHADELVVAMGPWLPKHVPELDIGFTVERQIQFVLDAPMDIEGPEGEPMPVFTFEPTPGTVFYGVHRPDGLLKAAVHHQGERTDPDEVDRIVDQADERPLRELVEAYAPGLNGPVEETMVCLYTNTPDEHFLIDRHPKGNRTLLVSPCSGHGFKFTPAIGEAVAQLVAGNETELDRSMFRLERFL